MKPFQFATAKRIVCEIDASARLAEICDLSATRSCLLISDPGICQLGLHKPACSSLENAGLSVSIFNEVEADPSESVVDAAVARARNCQADLIIGLGGGSSMDVAKLVALLAHPDCQQSLSQVYGIDQALGQRLPLVQIPTTAGTGSEVTPVTIITTGETTKMGAVSSLFLPDIAILDAQLTVGLPPHITAATGIDAMVHAIEAYTSKIRKNAMSDMVARQALSLLNNNILLAFEDGQNLKARENMLLGAMLAGQAFANAPVAAVHALAYPLGGHFHIPHGLSNSLVLPHVLRFNAEVAETLYSELAPILISPEKLANDDESRTRQLIEHLDYLIQELQLPTTLRELDISEEQLDMLAKDAMLQQRLLVNNPRVVEYEDALRIYQAAY